MKPIKKKHSHILTNENGAVFLTLELRETSHGPEWSFTGIEGPRRNGDCNGSCGQCIDVFPPHIQRLWKKYHLNGMSPGTKEQDAFIEKLKATGWKYDYTKACEKLKESGLYEVPHPTKEDQLYKYGHEWIDHANPNAREIHDFFDSLRDDSAIYPWH